MRHESGVSEVLDTILLVGMITVTVSVILMYGIPIINMHQESIKERNVLSQFVYLSEQLSKVSTDVSPVVRSRISFSGGAISVTDDFAVNLTVTNASGVVFQLNKTLGRIKYESSDYSVSIENGGVFSDVMVSPPRIYKSGKNLSVALFEIRGSGSVAGSLSSFATVLMKYNATQRYEFTNGSLILKIYTDRGDAWKKFLESFGEAEKIDGGVELEVQFDRLTVNLYVVDVVIS